MNILNIKEILLNTNLFIENEYLEKYLELIENNKNTNRQKFKTQRHHIIPRSVCILYNFDFINKSCNIVNLLYKDHILAHYYLSLCSNNEMIKYKMFIAISFMIGNIKEHKNQDLSEYKEFLKTLPQYQELYEESKKISGEIISKKIFGHSVSEETKQKISKANKGRIYVSKDGVVRSICQQDLEFYLNAGWIRGNQNCNKRNLHKGDIVVHKGNIQKYIKKEELTQYLTNGWTAGRTEYHKQAVKLGVDAFYKSLTKEEIRKKYTSYGMLGKHQSEETKMKCSIALKGRKQSEDQKIKTSRKMKGTIHMTNGVKDIMIKSYREEEFLKQGFWRGRSKNRKENR